MLKPVKFKSEKMGGAIFLNERDSAIKKFFMLTQQQIFDILETQRKITNAIRNVTAISLCRVPIPLVYRPRPRQPASQQFVEPTRLLLLLS